jgi:hypothetical protein
MSKARAMQSWERQRKGKERSMPKERQGKTGGSKARRMQSMPG